LETYSVITGTGSYRPEQRVPTEDFVGSDFFEGYGLKLDDDPNTVIDKFVDITNIRERRYMQIDEVTSDLAANAALLAVNSSNVDKEKIDRIIVAHNFGDVFSKGGHSRFVPSIASRVKRQLDIKNPYCEAHDLAAGCPGWITAVISANAYIKEGSSKNILVIGAEGLSRVSDPTDRDSMIYADGAGAVMLSAVQRPKPCGIIASRERTDADLCDLLRMGKSFNPETAGEYLKMDGRKLFAYALDTVPKVIKECLDGANVGLNDVAKVFLHQANERMDVKMFERLAKLYGQKPDFSRMPLTISYLGNSSVATIPTLFDMVVKGCMPEHQIHSDDLLVFASVGAGMNINVLLYRNP
jgi:3-oxoacyl-[acyl-carrier-protein] synthase-3